MVDIDPVCWYVVSSRQNLVRVVLTAPSSPSGFQVYSQVLVGNYPPCVSTLTVPMTADSSVLASISSAAAASVATATTTTITVIVNQVFAVGLPCADNVKEHGNHLTTAAKAGIGAGAGVFGLLLIGFIWCWLAVRHRRRKKMKNLQDANTAAGGPIRPEYSAYNTTQADPKHMSMATTAAGSPPMQQQQQQQFYGGTPQHGFSPAFGYAGSAQMAPQHDPYSHPYGIQPVVAGYPAGMTALPHPQSPPPPFYPSSTGGYDPHHGYYKPPAEVPGEDVPIPPSSNRYTSGMSDSQSQVTSTTAVAGSNYQTSDPKHAAELSTHPSTRH